MPTRKCPTCGTQYREVDTNCTRCPETPAALAIGTAISAQLMLAEPAASGLTIKNRLNTAQYRIEKVLGWGGMATAYVVREGNGTKVIKEIRPNGNPKVMEKMVKSFLREAEIQFAVGQWMTQKPPAFPALPKGYGCFEGFGRLYMAMDLMDGTDFDKIQDTRRGQLPLPEVVQMGMEMCIILRDYLHGFTEGGQPFPLIHRDIKPANILRLHTTNTACLLDYGIARPEELSAKTWARGTRAGSEAFAPPEFKEKGVKPTLAFDTYCLCSTIWSLLVNAKELPGTRDMLLRSIAGIGNAELQGILIRGTEDIPARRFQTAEELRQALERVYIAQRALPSHLARRAAPVRQPSPPQTQPAQISPPRTITLPNKQQVALKEGEALTIARNDTVHTVTVQVSDPTVSSTPIRVFAKSGELYVTGGGSTGFAITTTVRHPANQPITLPSLTAQKITFMVEVPDPALPPVTLSASGGSLRATGGGTSGISLALTTRYKPSETIKVPRGSKVQLIIGKDIKLSVE